MRRFRFTRRHQVADRVRRLRRLFNVGGRPLRYPHPVFKAGLAEVAEDSDIHQLSQKTSIDDVTQSLKESMPSE